MELRICAGINKVYRLAIVTEGDFDTVSEHDSACEAMAARRQARDAADAALKLLETVYA
jgi:hypothetical protein